MGKNPKEGKLLYHITCIDNLESIVQSGLLPRNNLKQFIDVADEEILAHREKYDLNGLVPFHFFAPTPFAGRIQKDNRGKKFVYLTIQREYAQVNGYKIFPTHPLNFKHEPLDFEEGIDEIDWDLMSNRDFTDHDCAQVCMAECVTDIPIKFADLHCLFVRTNDDYYEVDEIIEKAGFTGSIDIMYNSYFFIND